MIVVGHCLATEVLIGKLPDTRELWMIIGLAGGDGPTNKLQDLNWGAFHHESRASQLRSCNYYTFYRDDKPDSKVEQTVICYVVTIVHVSGRCTPFPTTLI